MTGVNRKYHIGDGVGVGGTVDKGGRDDDNFTMYCEVVIIFSCFNMCEGIVGIIASLGDKFLLNVKFMGLRIC